MKIPAEEALISSASSSNGFVKAPAPGSREVVLPQIGSERVRPPLFVNALEKTS